MGKCDLCLEGKNTKSIDQKAPFTLVGDHIRCSDACIVVMDYWHRDALRRRDPSHELALAPKFVLQKAQAITGRRNTISCDPDDVVPTVLRRCVINLDDRFKFS